MKTKPTISVLAEETGKPFAEPTKSKPTISVLAEETGKTFAEPILESITKEAADTTEPDWLNSMAVDSFFNSDGDIDSMGLDVSDDGKDSVISVEKEIIMTHNEPVALVFPFVTGIEIENASKGLHLGEENSKISSSHILQLQQQKVAPRSHFVTVYQKDFNRLNPGQYLNDSVVDFWLQRITRKEANEEQ
jgi:hypothetical protein